MRVSAALIVLGFLVGPAGLAVGMSTFTIGAILLPLGLAIGLVTGNTRYRVAVLLAVLGSGLIAFGLLLVTIGGPGRQPVISEQEVALLAGLLLWAVAIALGTLAMLRDTGAPRSAPGR